VVGPGTDSGSSDVSITAVDPTVVGPQPSVGIGLVTFGFGLGGPYRERLAAFDEGSYFELGWTDEPPSDESIEPIGSVTDMRTVVSTPGEHYHRSSVFRDTRLFPLRPRLIGRRPPMPYTLEISDDLKERLDGHLEEDETHEEFIAELVSMYETEGTFLQEGYSE